MKNIKSMTKKEIAEDFSKLGQPAFRGGQVFKWLHSGCTSFDDMTNLPKSFRDML